MYGDAGELRVMEKRPRAEGARLRISAETNVEPLQNRLSTSYIHTHATTSTAQRTHNSGRARQTARVAKWG